MIVTGSTRASDRPQKCAATPSLQVSAICRLAPFHGLLVLPVRSACVLECSRFSVFHSPFSGLAVRSRRFCRFLFTPRIAGIHPMHSRYGTSPVMGVL